MKKHFSFATLGALGLTTLAAACSAPPPDRSVGPVIVPPQPASHPDILNGTIDTTHESVVVITQTYKDGSTTQCTGTLIAPTLVLTARHCVAYYDNGQELCALAGREADGFQLPTYSGDVVASAFSISRVPGGPVLARGAHTFDDGGRTSCAHDLAILQLDAAVRDLPLATVRRTPVAVGEKLTVVGWGYVDDRNTSATSRMEKQTVVRALGPTVAPFHPYDDATQAAQNVTVASGELAVDVGTTAAGDSGGPSFDAQGEVVSVVSRGFVPASMGPDTFTAVAAHLDIVDQAFHAAGFVPDAGPAGGGGGGGADAGGAGGGGGSGGGAPSGGGPVAPDGGGHARDAGGSPATSDETVIEVGRGCSAVPARAPRPTWLVVALAMFCALAVFCRARRGAARRVS